MSVIVHTCYELDEEIARIQFVIDDEAYSEWVWDGATIKTDAVPKSEFGSETGLRAVESFMHFAEVVNKRYGPPVLPYDTYTIELESEEGKVKTKLSIGGVKYLDYEWNAASDVVKLKARPAIDFSWPNFVPVLMFWRDFHQAIAEHSSDPAAVAGLEARRRRSLGAKKRKTRITDFFNVLNL